MTLLPSERTFIIVILSIIAMVILYKLVREILRVSWERFEKKMMY